MKIREYQLKAKKTDYIPWEEEFGSDVPLLGLLGETGTLSTVLKRGKRDGEIYTAFNEHLREDLGDILWYVAIIATRLGMVLNFSSKDVPGDSRDIFGRLYSLAKKVLTLTEARETIKKKCDHPPEDLARLINDLLLDLHCIARFNDTTLECIADENLKKNQGYWISDTTTPAMQFDKEFPEYERFPRIMEIDFIEINNGKGTLLRMKGVNIGNRLTDNAPGDDGYRYHDVFHLANVATFGWSPVFRSILQCKRKSNPVKDEIEDGARAAIIEEAVINHIYDYARDHKYFEGKKRVDFNLIKRVLNMVRNYEVEQCQPWEWQHCILEGYKVFRQLKEKKKGRVLVNSELRSIKFIEQVGN